MSDQNKRTLNEIDKIVAENISFYRKQTNITQEDMGKRIGISFQQYQKYENGLNRISIGRLVPISKILNVGIDCLLKNRSDCTN